MVSTGNVEPDETWDDIDQVDPAEASLLNKLLRRTVVENDRVHVEVIQSDPTSPLFSVKTFEELRLWVPLKGTPFFLCFHLVYAHFRLLKPEKPSCWRESIAWDSTGRPRSKRPRYPCCWPTREFKPLFFMHLQTLRSFAQVYLHEVNLCSKWFPFCIYPQCNSFPGQLRLTFKNWFIKLILTYKN